MAIDWGFLPSLISAASGLGGVWLGGRLTSKREESREAARSEKEASYLAILVVAHLDRFVNDCVSVADDDGTSYGSPAGKNGTYEPTVERPDFDPLSFDVNWMALPPTLKYDILGLPYSIEMLNRRISNAAEHDGPPDYAEFFWERRHGYTALGLAVSRLANRLRQHAGLTMVTHVDGDWSRDDYLKERKESLEKIRDKYRKSCSQVSLQ